MQILPTLSVPFSSLSFMPSAQDLANLVYSLFIKNIAFLHEQTLPLQRHLTSLGLGLSSLGTVYTFLSNNTSNQQLFLLFGCIFAAATYYQSFLERSLQEERSSLAETKERLKRTELSLSDRDILIKTLDEAVKQLTISTGFFQSLKNSEGDIKLIQEHLDSIDKVTNAVLSHFKKTDAETALVLSEIKFYLSELNKKDIRILAILTKMDEKVDYIKQGVIAANESLDGLKGRENNC